jgi:hypothetical protein
MPAVLAWERCAAMLAGPLARVDLAGTVDSVDSVDVVERGDE